MIIEFITDFFGEVILGGVKNIGAWFRYLFLSKKYSFKEVLQQDWNNRIGFLVLSILIGVSILLFYY